MAYLDDAAFVLNIQPIGLPTIVRLSQNENGRRLYFTIIGNETAIPSGVTVTLSGTKPDGVVYSKVGSISNGVVLINEDTQLTAAAGNWDAKIKIVSGGQTVATGRVRFIIDADPVAPGSVPSDSQLEGLVAEAEWYAENARSAAYGSPLVASTVAGMTDHTRVYVYTGSETGYTAGNWYYWNGSAWTSGGVYNSTALQTDTTLAIPGMAADAKSTGDAIGNLDTRLDTAEDDITDVKSDLSKIDGTSAIYYSDHTLFVGDYDDPTKLYNLSDEDITRGYSVYRTATAVYPYIAENPARAMYTGWDLLLEPNKTYKVTATVSEKYADTAQMGINTYDQSALDAYAEEVSPFDMVAHSNDTGWQGLTVFIKTENTASGEPTVAMRIVFRQDTLNTPISDDFKVHRITIEEATNGDQDNIYELTDSDFTVGKGFVFGTSTAYPYFNNQPFRKTYTKYDLAVTSNKTYKVTATVPSKYANTAQMMIVLYDETLLEGYQTQATINTNSHTTGDGWTTLTHDILIKNTTSGEASVGMIISFKQSSSNPTISSDFVISKVEIRESGIVAVNPDIEEYIDKAIVEGKEHNIKSSDELNNYMPERWNSSTFLNAVTISEPEKEKMTHTSNIYDGQDGYLYVTYYANHSSDYEGITGDIISKIAKVSQCDLHDVTVIETLQKGQDFGTFVQSETNAPYDQILIPKDSDTFSYVFVATPQNGMPTVAIIDVDRSEFDLDGNAELSDFRYTLNGQSKKVVMNTTNLNTFLSEKLGLSSKTIGTYMILTKPILYNGEYYTYMGGFQSQSTGDGFGGCIIKTADYGKTWDFVAYNDDFTGTIVCMWEGSLDIDADGMAYCMLRAVVSGSQFGNGFKQRAVAVAYDITSGEWGDYKVLTGTINGDPADITAGIYLDTDKRYKVIEEDQSRPFVFIYKDNVYMLQNITPRMKTLFDENGAIRTTVQIWKFDKTMNLLSFKRLYNDASFQYFSFVNAMGRVYVSFTEDKRHLNFALKGDIAVMPVDFLD